MKIIKTITYTISESVLDDWPIHIEKKIAKAIPPAIIKKKTFFFLKEKITVKKVNNNNKGTLTSLGTYCVLIKGW